VFRAARINSTVSHQGTRSDVARDCSANRPSASVSRVRVCLVLFASGCEFAFVTYQPSDS
jgi:hypothetical protein